MYADQAVARWDRRLEEGIDTAPDVCPATLADRFGSDCVHELAARAAEIAFKERATKPALEHFEAAAEDLGVTTT